MPPWTDDRDFEWDEAQVGWDGAGVVVGVTHGVPDPEHHVFADRLVDALERSFDIRPRINVTAAYYDDDGELNRYGNLTLRELDPQRLPDANKLAQVVSQVADEAREYTKHAQTAAQEWSIGLRAVR